MVERIQIEGCILTVLAGTMFRVELDNKHQVLAPISGKMRKRFVRLTVGDRVKKEMSQYDLKKARIVWRLSYFSQTPRLPRPLARFPFKVSWFLQSSSPPAKARAWA